MTAVRLTPFLCRGFGAGGSGSSPAGRAPGVPVSRAARARRTDPGEHHACLPPRVRSPVQTMISARSGRIASACLRETTVYLALLPRPFAPAGPGKAIRFRASGAIGSPGPIGKSGVTARNHHGSAENPLFRPESREYAVHGRAASMR